PTGRLRIGLMLRAIDDVDGQGIYIRKLCDALFALDSQNEYVAFYSRASQAGRYRDRPNVREVVVPGRSKLIWDQVLVPRAARGEDLDVLFHHKFSIPALAPCPTVVQQRGTEYWTFPEYYPRLADRVNRVYNTLSIPFFCRRAARVLTNSDSLAVELEQLAGVPRDKMTTVYAAADTRFRPVTDARELARVRERHGLPERPFFLMVVKGYARIEASGAPVLCARKNVEGTLEAFAQARAADPACPPMVILGAGVRRQLTPETLRDRYGLTPEDVVIPGLIPHAEMPAVYSMTGALLFPSYYESFGIPLVEAMACGCPVITSSAPACPEVVGDAALVVDPDDVAGLRDAMLRVVREPLLARRLRERGVARAAQFTWEDSARRLLAELERAARRPPPRRGFADRPSAS
ncbi:MAG TPA: glycosyltransferase family 1 protein, partial [Gemmatimonadales bacterium]|nr:glycosyltransferase family 1 protein [Gemmatimonadales bacterium]